MFTKTKKIISGILIAVLALSLCACGSDKKDSSDVPTLTWYVPLSSTPDAKLVNDEVNKLLKGKIDAQLEIVYIDSGAFSERMKMNMASGKDFDLCFTSNWNNDYQAAVRNGGLYDMTDLLTKEFKDSLMPESFWKDAEVDGRIYAVPNVQIMTSQLAVYARKDIVDKYGFDLSTVKDIEDIEPFLEVVKKNEPDLYPYRKTWEIEPWTKDKWTKVSTYIAYDKDGNVEWFYDTPEAKKGVKTFREWYKKGYIRKDVASMGDDTTDYNQGKYAFYITNWAPGVEETAAKHKIPKVVQPITGSNFSGCRPAMTAIGANSKHPELAFELIKLVNSDKEIYNMISHGIKGKHYEMLDDNTIKYNSEKKYTQNYEWIFGNTFNSFVKDGQPSDIHELTMKANEEALTSKMTGFYFNTDNVKNEISNMTSVAGEYADFITVDDYDAFCKKRQEAIKSAGGDAIMKELKKQIKEYLKSQK